MSLAVAPNDAPNLSYLLGGGSGPSDGANMAGGLQGPAGTPTASPLSNTLVPEELFVERRRQFTEFLDSAKNGMDGVEYKEKISLMLRRGETRLIVSMNDVRQFRPDYCQGLLMSPLEYLPAFEAALTGIIESLSLPNEISLFYGGLPLSKLNFHIGLDGAFGEAATNPRALSTRFIGKLVALEGIVTSCFLVRPKLVKSVHYVDKKHVFLSREYRDATMVSNLMPTVSNTYPTEDSDGNALSTDYGYCVYRDHQKIVLQEMPERAPPGQLPRSMEVLLSDDLVDRVKPGDRVSVVGIYKSLASINQGQVPGYFRTLLLANNLKLLGKEWSQPLLTDVDIAAIKTIGKRSDVFELLGRSLAPSIYGHAYIKKSILLMLLGGLEKNLENTHIRGDINILMVGDPSTAKSQLLRFVLNIAPLAIATTGKGSSGVGLTAAVTTDKETGERRLEAGAMVLADRGVVCIDEFDKMSDTDRVAIHEVMEQQTVTIAKAGIHLSLNARCAVIAAANPVWSQYRESATPQENIRLPDSLLSRFDLLFIVLDTMNERHDRRISKHVTAMHRFLAPGREEGVPVPDETFASPLAASLEGPDDRESMETPIFERFAQTLLNPTDGGQGLAAPAAEGEEGEASEREILTTAFVKKYIHYAKLLIKPVLTIPASDTIRRVYNAFRTKKQEQDSQEEKTLPVTPRTLETLIRLATAHAKARLSPVVEEVDALVAEELVRFCLYKEVKSKKTSKKRRTETVTAAASDADSDSEEDEDGDTDETANDDAFAANLGSLGLSGQRRSSRRTTAAQPIVESDADEQGEEDDEEGDEPADDDEFSFTEKAPRRAGREPSKRAKAIARLAQIATAPIADPDGSAELEASGSSSQAAITLTPNMVALVKEALLRIRDDSVGESFFSLSNLLDALKIFPAHDDTPQTDASKVAEAGDMLTQAHVEAVLDEMDKANQIMYRDHMIIFI